MIGGRIRLLCQQAHPLDLLRSRWSRSRSASTSPADSTWWMHTLGSSWSRLLAEITPDSPESQKIADITWAP